MELLLLGLALYLGLIALAAVGIRTFETYLARNAVTQWKLEQAHFPYKL